MTSDAFAHGQHYFETGDHRNAATCFQQVLDTNDKLVTAWFMLGASRHAMRELDEALSAFEHVLLLEPEHPQAPQAAAAVLIQLGRPRDALVHLAPLLARHPKDAQINYNVGVAYEALPNWPSALRYYDRALESQPDMREAMRNRSNVLAQLLRLDEALANNQRYVELFPGDVDAHFNLGHVLLALSRYDEAITASTRALELDPKLGRAELDCCLALGALGRIEEAWRALERAYALDARSVHAEIEKWAAALGVPVELDPREVYVVKNCEQLDICDWSDIARFRQFFARFAEEVTPKPVTARSVAFRALNFGLKPELQLPLMRGIAATIESIAQPWRIDARPAVGKRIRLGYLSPDYREHAVGILTQSLFSLHDRERFEVFGYDLTPTEISLTRNTIKTGCDQFRVMSRLTAKEIATQIAADGIDILIDLGGYTAHTRSEAVAARPAPLTVSYMGFLGTMGADFIDYLIADRVVVPKEEEGLYHENIVLLPHTFWIYGLMREVPPTPYRRKEYGLPGHSTVFCVSHAGYKISPEIFDVWMHILVRSKGSVLWLIAREPRIRDNLRREAERRGVSAERLIFSPGAPHSINLSRLQLADLFLDTPQYNAGATGLDALWAGLPMLTCPTRGIVGRMAASALLALDCPELITGSFKEYEDKAVAYASQPDTLAAIRTKLAKARTGAALFDTRTRVRELEAAYTIMIERYRAGLPPASFKVPT